MIDLNLKFHEKSKPLPVGHARCANSEMDAKKWTLKNTARKSERGASSNMSGILVESTVRFLAHKLVKRFRLLRR